MDAVAAEITISISHVIVHDLIKAKSGHATTDPRDAELEVTALVQRVIDTLVREYRRRASKSHGRFLGDTTNVPVPGLIRQYAIDKTLEFVPLTHSMLASLRDRADQQPGATGGHVLIAQVVEPDGEEGLLVAILTEEVGAAITKSKDMQEARYLNMKGFRYAGRVSLTGLAANAERYVSFLRGTGKEVSDYFKIFLGCDTTIVALAETKKLTGILRSFASEQGMDETQRAAFLKEANDVCKALAQAGELFEVEPLANKLWPKAPQELITALENPEVGLSAGFVPHLRGLRDLVKFSGGRSGVWKVEFERQAIIDGDVVFDPKEKTLTFGHLPADLLVRLQEETGEHD
jgi:nucleoid-associated protein